MALAGNGTVCSAVSNSGDVSAASDSDAADDVSAIMGTPLKILKYFV